MPEGYKQITRRHIKTAQPQAHLLGCNESKAAQFLTIRLEKIELSGIKKPCR